MNLVHHHIDLLLVVQLREEDDEDEVQDWHLQLTFSLLLSSSSVQIEADLYQSSHFLNDFSLVTATAAASVAVAVIAA